MRFALSHDHNRQLSEGCNNGWNQVYWSADVSIDSVRPTVISGLNIEDKVEQSFMITGIIFQA